MRKREVGRARRRQDRDREGHPGDAARRALRHRRDRLARRSARERGGAQARHRGAYGSYEDLLADPEIEAIYNPLPNELHVPWTIKALEAGKHVLCEKPIALDAAEARTLIAARDKAGKLVAEAFMVRYHPQWRRARETGASGAIGASARSRRFSPIACSIRRMCATGRRAAAAFTTSAATRS